MGGAWQPHQRLRLHAPCRTLGAPGSLGGKTTLPLAPPTSTPCARAREALGKRWIGVRGLAPYLACCSGKTCAPDHNTHTIIRATLAFQ